MPNARLLVVDDEPDIRQLLSEVLEDEGYAVATAEHAEAARAARSEGRFDAVLLDIWMPGTDGIALLREWKTAGDDTPVVMMSGHGTIETAVEATRLGAYDFIEKPVTLAKLLITLERALEAQRLRADNQALRRQLSPPVAPLGESPAMQRLRAQLERLAGVDAPVLLLGEAGTGKEGLARWMHEHSARASQPFVTVAGAAIADEAAAATLFGSEGESGSAPGLIERGLRGHGPAGHAHSTHQSRDHGRRDPRGHAPDPLRATPAVPPRHRSDPCFRTGGGRLANEFSLRHARFLQLSHSAGGGRVGLGPSVARP